MERFGPAPRNPELDNYPGEWVAVKDGHVVAHSADPLDVVKQVRANPSDGRSPVVEYVGRPEDPIFCGWLSL